MHKSAAIPLLAVVYLLPIAEAGAQLEPGSGNSRGQLPSTVSITRDGDVVGTIERDVRETERGREFTTRQTVRVNVPGTSPSTVVDETIRTEDRNGQTIAIRHRSSVDGYDSITTAAISDGVAIVRRDVRDQSREVTLSLPAGLRFDNGAGLLENWSSEGELEFFALDIRAPSIQRIVYAPVDPAAADGERELLRLAYADGFLRSVSRLRFDSSGDFLASDQPLFGSGVTIGVAADAVRGSSTDPLQSALVRSPYRISRDALSGHIRYTFAIDGGIQFQPPQTGEQRVSAVPGGVVVDTCIRCGPGLAETEEDVALALEPTFWLESDDPVIARIGNRVGERSETDAEKMTRLESWARRRMGEVDFAGHFSAAETVARREGDCTESAVLLAALGRAAGIPTRVASGIVYSREQYHGVGNVFMPHAWTLAYVDGEWRSFDSALDGFDASHIALTVSDGDPGSIQAGHQLAALLRWENMVEVRRAPEAGAP